MFVEHQSTSGTKIYWALAVRKSVTALLFVYGNYGVNSICPYKKRINTHN